MPKLILNDEQLRAHLPNIIQSVKGETPFYERISVFLDLAEDWVRSTFTSEPTFNTICGYTDSNNIKILCCRLVVADAMRRAIPSLDVILTPNGFGVVNSTNVAPASKPRVDRLVGSMTEHRDDCIAALLPELTGASRWLSSSQAAFFGATLFPDLAVVDALGHCPNKWDKYLEVRSQFVDLEAGLAEEWFSPELMGHLRFGVLRKSLTQVEGFVAEGIKAQLVRYLREGSFNARRLADIVNVIRQSEDDFPLWHGSEVAKLFAPPKFVNRKDSGAYFF